jgi:hypothetical protein
MGIPLGTSLGCVCLYDCLRGNDVHHIHVVCSTKMQTVRQAVRRKCTIMEMDHKNTQYDLIYDSVYNLLLNHMVNRLGLTLIASTHALKVVIKIRYKIHQIVIRPLSLYFVTCANNSLL